MLSRHLVRCSPRLRRTPFGYIKPPSCLSTTATCDTPRVSTKDVDTFNLKRVCLLRKITRYEFEQYTHRHQTKNEAELKTIVEESELPGYRSDDDLVGLVIWIPVWLRPDLPGICFIERNWLTDKGSDFQGLVDRHDEYKRRLEKIHEEMVKRGLTVDVVKRPEYTVERIAEADAVFTAGGDGTFLMAATKVEGKGKPVIGINTDTVRSEGKLCLLPEHSMNIGWSLDRILSGNFKWMWRNRIRITMLGHDIDDTPVDIHDQELMYPEFRHWEHVRENEMHFNDIKEVETPAKTPPVVLPIWALNEVFIGESLAARVSFYEVSINGSQPTKQKSSGITVCTGTGSTSWFFNINHVPTCSVQHILKIAKKESGSPLDITEELCQKVADRFNNSLTFDPSKNKMAFVVRDPVPHGIFGVAVTRGFCKNMMIRSRMFDAWVAVDGGVSFRFNDGAVAVLEMMEEDALRGVWLG